MTRSTLDLAAFARMDRERQRAALQNIDDWPRLVRRLRDAGMRHAAEMVEDEMRDADEVKLNAKLTEALTDAFPAPTEDMAETFDGPPDPRFPSTGIVRDMSRATSSGPTAPEGYADLAAVLQLALRQSSEGKGKDRHAGSGLPFDRQPIMEIARMTQGVDFHTGQVMKKAQEASTMVARGQHDRARAELLGAIVYAAAAFKRAGELKDRASPSASE